MAIELRKTGISVVGDMPWGTHFCQFFETKEDLLDILIPYFKAGLQNNEFCMWVVSEPLSEEEAKNALKQSVPEVDRYLAAGRIEIVPHASLLYPSGQETSSADHIEIIPHTEWYLKEGVFDLERVINGWNEKLTEALARGYDGMRVNGNEAWLTKENWQIFSQYEKKLNELIANQRMIVLCSYPLARNGAAEIFDVAHTHQFAIARRKGNWHVLETPELRQAKAEIKRLNEDLEQRVVERTRELAAANEKLKTEIAERKQIEEALRQSEERFAAFMDNLPGYAWMKDLQGRYVYINQMVRGLPGYGSLGKTDAQIWPADLAAEYRANDQQVIAAKKPLHTVEHYLHEGKKRYMVGSKFPIFDKTGAVALVGGAGVDITERIEAEEALRESESRLQLALDAARMGCFDWDMLSGKIIWSSVHANLIGVDPNSFRGTYQEFDARVHPEDREGLDAAVVRARDERTFYSHEYRIIWPDGTVHWVAGQGQFFYDPSGKPTRMSGVVMDITERKYAEEKLRKSEVQLAEAQQLAQLGSWSRDLATNVVAWSDEIFRIFGMEPQKSGTTYQAFLEKVHPDDRMAVRAVIEDAFKYRRPFSCEYRIIRLDGAMRIIHERGSVVFDNAGKPVRAFGAVQDITERKHAEEELRNSREQLRKLAAYLQSVREEERKHIARELHDEIGEGLTAIKLALERSASGQPADATTELARALALANKLIGQVRDLSLELRPAMLDDLGLLAALRWHFERYTDQFKIAVDFKHSGLSDRRFSPESETAVYRIVQEALTNVARHAQIDKVAVQIDVDDDLLRVQVKDEGIGFDPNSLPLERASGLTGMRERAIILGGRLWLESAAGLGTILRAEIPLHQHVPIDDC